MSDYIDGDMKPRARRRLEAHAVFCPECGPLLRTLLTIVHGLAVLPRPLHEPIAPAVIERLRRESDEPPERVVQMR
jgi:anti-sigma factor RsiW